MPRARRDPPVRAAPEQWSPGPSIFDALKADEGDGFRLPDAPPTPAKLRFADGLLDGAGIADDDPADVSTLVDAVDRLARHPNPETRRDAYERLRDARALIAAEPLVAALAEQGRVRRDTLATQARWLLHAAAHREPLKFALILLGASGGQVDLPDLEIAARSDEFTLFAAIAAGNLVEDPRDVWWRMAKKVHGWGRVTSLAMLAPRCADRLDIRGWLVREACHCDLAHELAFGCAEHGRLREQLEADEIDDPLLDGGCQLLGLLCDPLAPRGLDDYADGLPAVRTLVAHLERRCNSLERLFFARELHRWLEWPRSGEGAHLEDPDRWLEREQAGWTRAARAELSWACVRLAQGWEPAIRTAAESEASTRRWLGWELAEWRGIDLWEGGFERLRAHPTDDYLWFKLLRSGDPARLERLRALAEEALPLDAMGSGPTMELLSTGADPAPRCLGTVLQEIKLGRLWSARLVRAGLSSPWTRNRHLAVGALEQRPRADWGKAIEDAVSRALFEEPDEALRELLRRLAKGH